MYFATVPYTWKTGKDEDDLTIIWRPQACHAARETTTRTLWTTLYSNNSGSHILVLPSELPDSAAGATPASDQIWSQPRPYYYAREAQHLCCYTGLALICRQNSTAVTHIKYRRICYICWSSNLIWTSVHVADNVDQPVETNKVRPQRCTSLHIPGEHSHWLCKRLWSVFWVRYLKGSNFQLLHPTVVLLFLL